MENEAISSMKIAISLMIISLLILSINITVNIVKPTIYENIMFIVNIADQEAQKKYEGYNQTVVSGTKVIKLIKECENLDIGIIYQTYQIKENDYAKNVGTIFEGATTYAPYSNNDLLCKDAKIFNLSSWKAQRKSSEMVYTSKYLKKSDELIKCNNYINSIYTQTNKEYIAPGGRFYSELVKNSTGEVLGIIFTQQ